MYAERAAVVVPAHNEAERLGAVVEAAHQADPRLVFNESVIVVDNASTDMTTQAAMASGATVLSCAQIGKGYAMEKGAQFARDIGAGSLVFLDADLRGLTGDMVTALAAPVVKQEALMHIGYLGARHAVAKHLLRYWGAFSGQRAVSWRVWEQLSEADIQGWRVEAALNSILRNSGRGDAIQRSELPGVSHIGKRVKEGGWLKGIRAYGETYASATRGLLSSSRLEG